MASFHCKFLLIASLAFVQFQTSWSETSTGFSVDSKLEDSAYLDQMQRQLRSDVLEAERLFVKGARSIENVTKRYIAAQIKSNMFKALRVLAEKELSTDIKTAKQVPRIPRQQEPEDVEEETEATTRRAPSMILPQVAQLLKVVFGGNINLTAHVETATNLLPKPVQTQILGVVKLLANNAGYQYITSTSTSTSTVATTSTTVGASTKSSRTKTSTATAAASNAEDVKVKTPTASTNPDDEFFPDIGESTSMRTRIRRTTTAATSTESSSTSTTKKSTTTTTPATTTEDDEDIEEESGFGVPPGANGFPGFGGQGNGGGGFPGDGRIRTGEGSRLKPRQFPDILGSILNGLANNNRNNNNRNRQTTKSMGVATRSPVVITTRRPNNNNQTAELFQGLGGAINQVGAGVFAVANGAGAGLGQAINIAGSGVLAVANGAGQGIGQVLQSFGAGINSTLNGHSRPVGTAPSAGGQTNPMLPGINITMLSKEIGNGLDGVIKRSPDIFKGAQEAVKLIESVRDILAGGGEIIDTIDI